jgi:hypothetical protein
VKFCRREGTNWAIETVDDSADFVGCETALAFDDQGYPSVVYTCYDEGDRVKFAAKTGSQWDTSFVWSTSTEALRADLDIDDEGVPHVVYEETDFFELTYCYRDGGTWHKTILYNSAANPAVDSKIVVEDSGRRHVAFSVDYTQGLRYATSDGGSWDIETVPTTGDAFTIGFDLDGAGRPHICYAYDDNEIRYVFWDGNAWVNEDVATCAEGDILGAPSLAIDDGGYVWVAYQHLSGTPTKTGDLYCAWRAPGGGWTSELVDDAGDVGLGTSVAAGPDGFVGIAYYEVVSSFSGRLKFAWTDSDIPVELAYFRAAPADGGIDLAWSLSAPDPAIRGFNLYRRPAGTDSAWKPLNRALITGATPYSFRDGSLAPGRYEYRLDAVKGSTTEALGNTCGTLGAARVVAAFSCYPNPARTRATVAFELGKAEDVSLAVYDVAGRKVRNLADGRIEAGPHEFELAGLTPGLYVTRLTAGDCAVTKRIVWVDR